MKEINIKEEIVIDVKKKEEIKHELIGKILPKKGHTLFEINKIENTIEVAKFKEIITIRIFENNHKELIAKDNCVYISALNKKNALKKYNNLFKYFNNE